MSDLNVRPMVAADADADAVLTVYQAAPDGGDANAGFRLIGTRERVGRHHGRWRDVLLLERRSPVVV